MERFEKDLASGQFRERVKNDFMGMYEVACQRPSFFIDGERHDAAPDEASLLSALQPAA
jgi:hypothetical protein